MAYGLRLATFLARRMQNPGYRAANATVQSDGSLAHRLAVVCCCAAIQVPCALLLRLASIAPPPATPVGQLSWVGLLAGGAGLVLQALADEEKLTAAMHPVTTGLYETVRHPNYLGGVVFHLGMCTLALHAEPIPACTAVALGPLLLVRGLVNGAHKLDYEGQVKYHLFC
jgi:steroid 5-alpha reductase family enzyme